MYDLEGFLGVGCHSGVLGWQDEWRRTVLCLGTIGTIDLASQERE